MTAVILQIIVGLLALVKAWADHHESAEAVAERRADAIQLGRENIINCDADAVSARIDRVLSQAAGDNAGGKGGAAPAGTGSTEQRLAALGIGVDPAPGAGGKVPEQIKKG